MGQGCSGDLSNPVADVIAPTASTAVQLAAAAGFARKNSAWKQLYCKRIEGIISTLTSDDIATLLVSMYVITFINKPYVKF